MSGIPAVEALLRQNKFLVLTFSLVFDGNIIPVPSIIEINTLIFISRLQHPRAAGREQRVQNTIANGAGRHVKKNLRDFKQPSCLW